MDELLSRDLILKDKVKFGAMMTMLFGMTLFPLYWLIRVHEFFALVGLIISLLFALSLSNEIFLIIFHESLV